MGLAAAFQQEVIAEGVETSEQGLALMEMGCELAQGYYISKLMAAKDLPSWVKNWKVDASWLNVSADEFTT